MAPEYSLDVIQWFFAFLAAFTLGMGKAGIKGLGPIIVTLMALVFGGKASTGVLIPLMILADIFAVIYYNRYTEWHYLKRFLPMMLIGVLLGVWWGDNVSEVFFKQLMAFFILLTVVIMVWMEKRQSIKIPKHWTFATGMGLISGITSMIGNLAGSFANIYFLAMRLPKNAFIGTAAWLFFIINVFKLPFHIFVWKTVSIQTLWINLYLIPAILIGFFVGVKITSVIKNETYRKFILFVTAIGALLILIN